MKFECKCDVDLSIFTECCKKQNKTKQTIITFFSCVLILAIYWTQVAGEMSLNGCCFLIYSTYECVTQLQTPVDIQCATTPAIYGCDLSLIVLLFSGSQGFESAASLKKKGKRIKKPFFTYLSISSWIGLIGNLWNSISPHSTIAIVIGGEIETYRLAMARLMDCLRWLMASSPSVALVTFNIYSRVLKQSRVVAPSSLSSHQKQKHNKNITKT